MSDFALSGTRGDRGRSRFLFRYVRKLFQGCRRAGDGIRDILVGWSGRIGSSGGRDVWLDEEEVSRSGELRL